MSRPRRDHRDNSNCPCREPPPAALSWAEDSEGNVFSGAELQAARHSMSCLLHSVSLWNRNCKCSNGQEQVQQPFINPKVARTPGLRSPMSRTEFTQHPQPPAHYKRHPISQLVGHKLYRGNLGTRGTSICLDIPAMSTSAILDAVPRRSSLQNSYATRQDDLPGRHATITSLHHIFSTANTYQNH